MAVTVNEILQRGWQLQQQAQSEQAEALYREVLRVQPGHPGALFCLGVLANHTARPELAVECLVEAIRGHGSQAEFHVELGSAYQALGRPDDAIAAYREALRLKPESAMAHNNLGMVFQSLRRWDEAFTCYREAARIEPRWAEPHCNQGTIRLANGQYDEARAHFETALEIQPDCASAHYHRGMLLLGQGDYPNGWAGFQRRFDMPEYASRKPSRRVWDGSPLAGRTILIHSEQGFGDTFHFVRYLPLLAERGASKVYFVAPKPLLRFLAEQGGVGELVSPDARWPDADVDAGLMSLPYLFRTTAHTIPASPAYLRADADLIAKWRSKLAGIDGFKIGIAWQGNRRYAADHLRSIPLAEFHPLTQIPGVRLISLQQGEGREQLSATAREFDVVDLGEQVDCESGPFRDTAAIVKNVDLVICSDSSIAHLAGALGAPVWLALSSPPEWRWGLQGDTSPWYGGMRLFRQSRLGNWGDVFARMARELSARDPLSWHP